MKTRTKFVALLSAIAFFMLSLFGLGGALRAFADGEAMPADPDPTPKSLYYFSDYYQCEEYYNNGFIRDILNEDDSFTYSELNYWNYGNSDGFWTQFYLYNCNEEFDKIENAFVIVEVRNSFTIEPVSEEWEHEERGYNFFLLEEVFSQLKGQNCQIMFICGLDEVYFDYNEYDAFLEYVDIHIKVDFASTYAQTMLYELTDGYWDNGLREPTTLIFDSRLPERFWMYRVLATYFMYLSSNNPGDSTEEQPFLDFDLKVLLYDHERGELYSFFQYFTKGIENIEPIAQDDYKQYLDVERIYIVGNS